MLERKGQTISISTLAKLVLALVVLAVVVFIAQSQIGPMVDDAVSSILAHQPQ